MKMSSAAVVIGALRVKLPVLLTELMPFPTVLKNQSLKRADFIPDTCRELSI